MDIDEAGMISCLIRIRIHCNDMFDISLRKGENGWQVSLPMSCHAAMSFL